MAERLDQVVYSMCQDSALFLELGSVIKFASPRSETQEQPHGTDKQKARHLMPGLLNANHACQSEMTMS